MEMLHSWITTLVAAVLITNFLEMLLPDNDLKKFVRVVLGIFIIVTILHPLLGLLHQNINFEHIMLKASGQGGDGVEDVLAKGRQFKQVTGGMAQEQYTKGLARQVRSLALLVDGVADAKAAVQLEKKAEGKIEIIKIGLKTKGIFPAEPGMVKPVEVQVFPTSATVPKEKVLKEDQRLIRAVRETVINFYNLSADQVEVHILD